MDGIQHIPIQQARQSLGFEKGSLDDEMITGRHGQEFKLQPGFARNLHFSPQAEQVVGLQGFHAPEIKGVADAQVSGMAPAAA